VRNGAIDGPTRYAAPLIDGVDDRFNRHLLELMRGSVTLPRRLGPDAPTRNFRARRLLAGDQDTWI